MRICPFWQYLFRVIFALGLFLDCREILQADDSQFLAIAERSFNQARLQYEAQPQSVRAAWEFSRACFDLADCATNKSQRAQLANLGMSAAQQALARDSNSAPARYYYGMSLAQLAKTKTLGALKLVRQMEHEFKLVSESDEHFDYAGADRNLGLLYRDAPSFGSIGDRTKAKQYLLQAVELAPDYPENRLNLIQAYLKWGQHEAARVELKKLEVLWPAAHTKFSGPE